MTKPTAILWLRRDLRITDNPALVFIAEHYRVIPIYIIDQHAPESEQLGEANAWWVYQNLLSLNKSMDNRLRIECGSPIEILKQVAEQYDAQCIAWNRCYSRYEIERDSEIKSQFQHIITKSFNGSLLWEPMTVLKKDGTPYKVFTPYYRKGCLNNKPPRPPMPSVQADYVELDVDDSRRFDVLLPRVSWYTQLDTQWVAGEVGAQTLLQQFTDNSLTFYKEGRDVPSIERTSKLSPYLQIGAISPHQVWASVTQGGPLDDVDENLDCYLSELGWREFSYYLNYHFPNLKQDNFNDTFDVFPWKNNQKEIVAWQKGQTGIPIVDAGMRELWQTGYMHNRVRMIVASFLIKNLLVDWRIGESWFWDTLLDADIASNAASWQWVAGCGADAAPYFRIFNPVLQGEKFDKDGKYVKKYCPELAKLPPKLIHKPWEAPSDILCACNVNLGHNYPKPIADLKSSRRVALDTYQSIK